MFTNQDVYNALISATFSDWRRLDQHAALIIIYKPPRHAYKNNIVNKAVNIKLEMKK